MTKLINQIDDSLLLKRDVPLDIDLRGAYYRDTTRILHSSSFSRLKHKTQVFYAPKNDHICTRIEHVLHVASIATSITKGFNLDADLAWAIGVGHDLGHSPFGHVGERILNEIALKDNLDPFQHEVNSLRVVRFLANKGKGLNLTYAVQDGIVTHCGEKFSQYLKPSFQVKDLDTIKTIGLDPTTYEGAIVRFSDSIAYIGRDFEDAKRLGIIDGTTLNKEVVKVLGSSNSQIISTLANNIIENSNPDDGIGFSDEVFQAVLEFKDYNYEHIYKSELLNGYTSYFRRLIYLIYEYLTDLFARCQDDKALYEKEKNLLSASFYAYYTSMKEAYLLHDGNLNRMFVDYIAGMSDNFAIDAGEEILKPEHLNEQITDTLYDKWLS